MMLLVLALVGLGQNFIQDDVTLIRTMGQVNGLWWRMNESPEKVVYVIGFMDGVDVVGSPALGGTLPVWPTYVQDWAGTKKVTNGEIV